MTQSVRMFIGALLLAASCGGRKFSVPKEPVVAGKLLLAKTAAEREALNEPRYLGVYVPDDLEVVLIGWDLVHPRDKELDYITVRSYSVEHENGKQKIIIVEFPMMYYVDFDNNADGVINRMYGFSDVDADGDPGNAELIQDPRKK